VQEFGWWIKSMGSDFSTKNEPVKLDDLLMEIKDFCSEMLKQNGNRLSIETVPHIILHTDRQLLRIVIRNIIDNANKNTQDGKISLVVTREGNTAAITLHDSGRGFSPAALEKLRQLILQPFTSFSQAKGNNGYGYYFITDFCKLMDIKIWIGNMAGEGAFVTLDNLRIVGDIQLPSPQ
jgi:K+-sensing histidine kinase KdpD